MVRALHDRAKNSPKKVVFTEADQLDVLKAAQIVFEEKIAHPILLGRKSTILELKEAIGFQEEVQLLILKKMSKKRF